MGKSINVDVDVDIYDIINELSDNELVGLLNDVLDELIADQVDAVFKKYIQKHRICINVDDMYGGSISYRNLIKSLVNIQNNYLKLTVEDQSIIEQISAKY